MFFQVVLVFLGLIPYPVNQLKHDYFTRFCYFAGMCGSGLCLSRRVSDVCDLGGEFSSVGLFTCESKER